MEAPAKFKRKYTNKSAPARPADQHDDSDEQQTAVSRTRGNMIGVSKLYFQITQNHEIKRCIDNTGWTQFLHKDVAMSDQPFVFACVKRWSPETHTFQFPAAELGITPYDFTSLTGIAVGAGTKLPPYLDSHFGDYNATINSYFPGFHQFQCTYENGALKLSMLIKYIAHVFNGGNILAPVEVISRAFCMHMLGSLFFPNGCATVGIGWLNYLVSMDEVGTYDWGTSILARIYMGLNGCKQKGMKGLYCFWQLIEYHHFEYLSTSGPKLVDSSDQSWPRMLRWRKGNRTSSRAHKPPELGLSQSQYFEWTTFLPFRDKFPYVAKAYSVSFTRHMLLDPQCGVVYFLGERCLRQLTGCIAIPVDPPTPMTYTDPNSYLQFFQMNTEELSYDKLSRKASEYECDAYYSSVVRGGAPIQCDVNTDVVGNIAAHMPEIDIPNVPTPAAKVAEYQNHNSPSGVSISSSIKTLMPDCSMPSLESFNNVTMVSTPRPAISFEASLTSSQSDMSIPSIDTHMPDSSIPSLESSGNVTTMDQVTSFDPRQTLLPKIKVQCGKMNVTREHRTRGHMMGVARLYFIITENSEIKQCVDKTGWTQFLFRHAARSDRISVFELVKRWSPKTHTFLLPEVELGITPYDFTTLTGIAVGIGTKLPLYSISEYGDYSATMSSYLPGFDCFQAAYKCRGLRVSRLDDYITHIYNDGNILVSVEVISRAFCMYMLGNLFFPNGAATVEIGWLNYLVAMDEVGTYDWGTAIIARMYLTLDRYKQDGMKNIYCFWQLIEYFAYEYFSTSCSKLVDSSDQLWPRMLRWSRDNQIAPKQVELGSPQSIMWTAFLPFRDKFPYVTEAYNVSVTRHVLLDPQWGAVYYLGERCVRQLTGLIYIPVDPPTPMAGIDLTSDLHLPMDVEELRYNKLSRQASQCEYAAYYSTVIRLWEPLHEYVVNTEEVGKFATDTPKIVKVDKFCKQSSQSGESVPSIDTLMPDWMMPSLDSSGTVIMVPVPRPPNSFKAPLATSYTYQQWRKVYIQYVDYSSSLWQTIVDREHQLRQQELQMEQKDAVIKERDAEIARLRLGQNPAL